MARLAAITAITAVAGLALAADAFAAGSWRLSPYGLGPLEVGMTADRAARAVGIRGRAHPGVGGDETCWELQAGPRYPGVWMMIQRGRVVRVSLGKGSRLRTERGLGVGDNERSVRAAYGGALRSEPHAYAAPPARYLTWSTPDRRYAIRFSTNEGGRITEIDAGRPRAVAAPEGCQ